MIDHIKTAIINRIQNLESERLVLLDKLTSLITNTTDQSLLTDHLDFSDCGAGITRSIKEIEVFIGHLNDLMFNMEQYPSFGIVEAKDGMITNLPLIKKWILNRGNPIEDFHYLIGAIDYTRFLNWLIADQLENQLLAGFKHD